MSKGSSVTKAIRSGWVWATDWIMEHWAAIIYVGSGGVMTYLASISKYFQDSGPFIWAAIGIFIFVVVAFARFLLGKAASLRVRAKYDEAMLEHGVALNPLDKIFERRRIYINDLALPSHPYIEDKLFVDCDLIGPANIYLFIGNAITAQRAPKMDVIWLSPHANFNNGFIFNNCVFRGCSFQRITMFAGLENYSNWKDNPNTNPISILPTEDHIRIRQGIPTVASTTDQPTLPGVSPHLALSSPEESVETSKP